MFLKLLKHSKLKVGKGGPLQETRASRVCGVAVSSWPRRWTHVSVLWLCWWQCRWQSKWGSCAEMSANCGQSALQVRPGGGAPSWAHTLPCTRTGLETPLSLPSGKSLEAALQVPFFFSFPLLLPSQFLFVLLNTIEKRWLPGVVDSLVWWQ